MKPLFFILLALFSINSTLSAEERKPVTISSSSLSDEERIVKNFNGVAAGGPIEVIVKFGNKESIRFEGDQDAISTLISEVKGNILIIRPQNSWKSWAKKYENKKITAYVAAKTIKSLTMSGSGNMSVNGKIKGNQISHIL